MHLNPEQFFEKSLFLYPAIFKDITKEKAKIRVFDHFFNSIGNGYNNFNTIDELINELSSQPLNNEEKQIIKKYYDETELYYGYETNDFQDPLKGIYTLDEQNHYPQIVRWIKVPLYPFQPYPNFLKEYSIVYKENYELLGIDWIETAIWYYKHMLTWFKTDEIERYHYAVTQKNINKVIKEYSEHFEKYSSNKEISQAYKTEYNGDIEKFAMDRWDKEYNRILHFITETIIYLENLTIKKCNA